MRRDADTTDKAELNEMLIVVAAGNSGSDTALGGDEVRNDATDARRRNAPAP